MRLNKRAIDGIKVPSGEYRIKVYDDEIHGYGISVHAAGRKSFFLEYGPARRRRRMKLGDYGALTADMARRAALDAKARIAAGEDPISDRERHRSL
ncbi:MAG: DUF4102 domain-containing protein, partial [Deltaproteobacteria bacterium]|nr:DUF4102 domain-containing protein [Deltaproteobacteria bacterium]